MNATSKLPGAWDTDRIVRTLANAMARAAMQGKSQPVAELALARIQAAK